MVVSPQWPYTSRYLLGAYLPADWVLGEGGEATASSSVARLMRGKGVRGRWVNMLHK